MARTIARENAWHMFALTCGLGGLQVVWAVVQSNGTDFLLSLGLSRPLAPLAWIPAPLAGIFFQPLMGILSDRCQYSLGRRRPFILLGTFGVTVSLISLSWVKPLTESVLTHFDVSDNILRTTSVGAALAIIWVLNLSIQPLQMGLRALIIDDCQEDQQARATAWAGYCIGAGGVLGYLSAANPLPQTLNLLRLTQFQALCFVAALFLTISVTICCCVIHERATLGVDFRRNLEISPWHWPRLYKSLPRKVRHVCQVQFCAWMGWFSFLYFSATYIGDLYVEFSETQKTTVLLTAANKGSLAGLIFAMVTLVGTSIIHILVDKFLDSKTYSFRTFSSHLSIARIWAAGNFFFTFLMFLTYFVPNWLGGAVLVGASGISWSIMVWAPFTILGQQLATSTMVNESEDEWIDDQSCTEVRVGTILSMHNIAISAPQICAAVLNSFIVWFSQVVGSHDSSGWVLRLGAFGPLLAAYLSMKLDM